MILEKISKIRKTFLLPLGGVILLVTGLALWTLSSLYDQSLTELTKIQRFTVTSQFNHEVEDGLELMSELAKQVMSDPEIIAAWNNRDREGLNELSHAYFQRFSESYGISHLYFIEKDQVCFLRVHQPDSYGDKIDRIVLGRAAKSGLSQSGMELGTYGALMLRLVQPWMVGDSLVGYLELGEEVDGIVKEIAEQTEVGIIITIDKRFLDRDLWESGLAMRGQPWAWDSVPYGVVVSQTTDFVPSEFSNWTRPINAEETEGSFTMSHDGRTYGCVSLYISDAGDRLVGTLYILCDITAIAQSFQFKFLLILIIGLVLTGLTIAFMDNLLAKKQMELEKSDRIRVQYDQLRQTHNKSEEMNRRLARAQRLARIGYWDMSLGGHGQWASLWASDEAFDILGMDRKEPRVSLLQLVRAIHPEDKVRVFKTIKLIVDGGRKNELDFRLASRQGRAERIIYAQATLIRSSKGVPVKLEGFIQEITDNVKTKAQERQLDEKLERADRMSSLGLMAGGVAHDLNNMLGPMVGYPELLLRKMPEDSPYRKQIQKIGNAAREAAEVVKDLLTLARRGRYEMAPLDLNQSIESYFESVNCCRLRDECPEVELTLDLADDLGLINGSASHMGQAIMNLVVNAYDAMPTGGKLTVTTERVSLNKLLSGYPGIPNGEYVLLRVADTGMGISKESIKRIFEPYYSKKKMGRSGSGLGLAVVYGIIKDHSGFYDVFSEEGEFTEIILYFPLATESAEIAAVEEPEVGGQESILVIDDTPVQLEVSKTLLLSHGYEIHTASSGQEAIDFIKSRRVDLILLDMIMDNGLDGLATYREILKIRPGQKAVIVTGASVSERCLLAQELGAGSILHKPFTLKEVNQAVRKELDVKLAGEVS